VKLSEIARDFQTPQIAEILIWRWVLVGLAVLSAIVVGYWIGIGEHFPLYVCAGLAVLLLVTFGMRQHAWILAVTGWIFAGNTEILPIPLSIRAVTVLLATCAYMGYRTLSKRDMRQGVHVLDGLIALNVGYLIATYIHHPVGFRAIGSEMVGGKPYLNIFIAVLAYWVIVHLPDSVKWVSRIPYFLLAGAVAITLLHVLAYVFPQLTPQLYFLYSGLDLDVYFGSMMGREGMTRLKELADFGYPMILVLCAYYPPRTLLNPTKVRFYLLLLAMACILVSGFRGIFLRAVVAFALGSALHRGWRELVLGAVAGSIFLALVVAGQGRFYSLPLPAQRTLSFLPGQWSAVAVDDAEGSSKWRFDLWQTIVRNHLIKDWWFGDGFGLTETDLMSMGHYGHYDEDLIMTGAYHSGPLTAIRYAGIVGLVLLYALMITAAFYSYQCVKLCRGTPLLPVAIFLAIGLIWQPVHYTFVFGGYDGALPQAIFDVALLRLVIRMAKRQKAAQRTAVAAVRQPVPRIGAPATA
jgi:hypothetical protein